MLDNFWIFAIFLSCIHSYMEEFFWRWFVFGNLRKLIPVGGAILLAGIGVCVTSRCDSQQISPHSHGQCFSVPLLASAESSGAGSTTNTTPCGAHGSAT